MVADFWRADPAAISLGMVTMATRGKSECAEACNDGGWASLGLGFHVQPPLESRGSDNKCMGADSNQAATDLNGIQRIHGNRGFAWLTAGCQDDQRLGVARGSGRMPSTSVGGPSIPAVAALALRHSGE